MITEVAKREFIVRSRTKSFRIITAILLFAAIAIPIAIKVWPTSDDLEEVTVGLAEGAVVDGADLPEVITLYGTDRYDFEFVDLLDADLAVDKALSDGEVDVVIEPGPALVWEDEVDPELGFLLEAALQQQAAIDKGAELGLNPGEVGGLLRPTSVDMRFVDEPEPGDDAAPLFAFVALIAAFVIPQAFGQLALMSVVEEKATGVVEVLLSHISPRTLLTGKVLGIGLLATCQMLIILAGMVASVLLVNTVDLPNSIWSFIPVFAISLIGGMAIYITLFALLGSLISRQEDASQVMAPVFIPIMAGYIVGQTAAFGPADSLIAQVLTFFPLTTPMLLPVRVARDAISGWEIAVALGCLALGVVILLRLAARLYEFALLHKGTRIGWKEAMGLLKSGTS